MTVLLYLVHCLCFVIVYCVAWWSKRQYVGQSSYRSVIYVQCGSIKIFLENEA